VDWCSKTMLSNLKAPLAAATTQLQLEMADLRIDLLTLQEVTRIWASFHFLPYDLKAKRKGSSLLYLNKYRLICNTNGVLVEDTIRLARDRGLQAVGLAMHILADTWAHRYFAGTPSLVINNINEHFYEILADGDHRIRFRHNPSKPDNLEKRHFTSCFFQNNEDSILNLGHGRAGHLPDYSFMRYKYMPAWGDYMEITKDNPSDYWHAFCQMIYAMKYLRGELSNFHRKQYAWEAAAPWKEEIQDILARRQLDSCEDWKCFGEKLSGEEIEDFDLKKYQDEYRNASGEGKKETYLGKFFEAAIAQKTMVTDRIFASGNLLAGFSLPFAAGVAS
ncbi:MAG: hypothetical protein IJV04_07195, partial [Lachnospiraceae bacterium]|nr:hypothetical protein [Lachnospiraceae bacterium]